MARWMHGWRDGNGALEVPFWPLAYVPICKFTTDLDFVCQTCRGYRAIVHPLIVLWKGRSFLATLIKQQPQRLNNEAKNQFLKWPLEVGFKRESIIMDPCVKMLNLTVLKIIFTVWYKKIFFFLAYPFITTSEQWFSHPFKLYQG